MRSRAFIAAALMLWLAAESRFSLAFFRANVESSFAGALAGLDRAIGYAPEQQPQLALSESAER
ncbi:MAG: hypothetical protein NW215_01150 [Hyphomicrobiales bacterium]|nr:hypothetical protein [Hyphomicrobiales bacterium]